MVPDVYQQFTKGMGVFCNPTSEKSPAKLRLAFEAAPFGLLVEKSGGLTSDGVTGGSILDVPINAVDQRTPVCMGSADEVKRFNGTSNLRSEYSRNNTVETGTSPANSRVFWLFLRASRSWEQLDVGIVGLRCLEINS
jgi:hypothetical protein